jgi:mannose-6-phosphate isomerase-like protein (cupin superfamily)
MTVRALIESSVIPRAVFSAIRPSSRYRVTSPGYNRLSTPILTPDAVSISIASATAPTTAAPAIANRACDRVLPPRPAHTAPASVIAARAPYGFIASESPSHEYRRGRSMAQPSSASTPTVAARRQPTAPTRVMVRDGASSTGRFTMFVVRRTTRPIPILVVSSDPNPRHPPDQPPPRVAPSLSSAGAAARRAERAAHRMARMEAFEVDGLEASRSAASQLYHEFLRRDSMSAGLYVLRTREDDPQTPHGQDELYYVISGRGRFRVGGEDRPVGPGTILFVEAGVEHRFHTITQDISVLVVFAPPEE